MVNDNRQRVSIAVPDLSDNSTSEDASWRDIAQGIVSDLKVTDRFALAQSNITLEANAVVPQFDRWSSTNTEWLVTGRVKKLGHRLMVEFRLWNLVKREHVLGKQYWIGSEDLQRISHVISEDIFKELTGEHHR